MVRVHTAIVPYMAQNFMKDTSSTTDDVYTRWVTGGLPNTKDTTKTDPAPLRELPPLTRLTDWMRKWQPSTSPEADESLCKMDEKRDVADEERGLAGDLSFC